MTSQIKRGLLAILALLALAFPAQAVLLPQSPLQNVQPHGFCAPGEFAHNGVICRNDPVNSYDALGLYGEQGHYYTTFIVARAAGLATEEALRLAFYSQLPDEVRGYDALSGVATGAGVSLIGGLVMISGIIGDDQEGTAVGIAGLAAGLGLEKHGEEMQKLHSIWNHNVRKTRRGLQRLISSQALSEAQRGVLLHTFADTYAHAHYDDSQLIATERFYSPPEGHLEQMKKPDIAGEDIAKYKNYVRALYDTLEKAYPERTRNRQILEGLLARADRFVSQSRGGSVEAETRALRLFAEKHSLVRFPRVGFEPEKYEGAFMPGNPDVADTGYSSLTMGDILELITTMEAEVTR